MNTMKEMEERITDRTMRACTDCNQSATADTRETSVTDPRVDSKRILHSFLFTTVQRSYVCTVLRNSGAHHGVCGVIIDAFVPEICSVHAIPRPPGL